MKLSLVDIYFKDGQLTKPINQGVLTRWIREMEMLWQTLLNLYAYITVRYM